MSLTIVLLSGRKMAKAPLQSYPLQISSKWVRVIRDNLHLSALQEEEKGILSKLPRVHLII